MENCKIIKIIDEYKVLVNSGFSNGLLAGSRLDIFVPGDVVKDIDTNLELGTLDFIKAKLIVETLYRNMCICISANESIRYSIPRYPETLNVDENQISNDFNKYNKTIQLGDLVRESLS